MTLPSLQPVIPAGTLSAAAGVYGDSNLDVVPTKLRPVLHVINGEHYSGAERVQDLLAARLPQSGFEVGFVCVKPGKFPSARQYRSAAIWEAPMKSRFDWRAIKQVSQIAKEGRFEIIHAHTPRSAVVARAAAALTGLPMVYHVHSPTSRDTTHRLRNRLNHWIERVSLTRIAALIAVSESLRRHMLSLGYPSSRVFTVPNGVGVPHVQRDATRPGSWTLGMTALFRPRKGLESLLDALAILYRQGVPLRLRAVGPFETDEYKNEIHQRIDRLGIGHLIDWTGFVTDVATELTKMDLFVLPSLFGEGLPMVVLEAMAAGVPVIATRVEGVPEAIEHGVSGLIANPNDPVSLADCIRSVVEGHSDWSALRQCALVRHATHFSDSLMAARLADVYRRIAPTS